MADMQNQLQNILQTPSENRDPNWENKFFNALVNSNLSVLSADPQIGPDNWPYLMTECNSESTESAQKIIHWLHDKGIGLVLNPTKDYPDYVFSYGMIWSFKETGYFYKTADKIETGVVEIQKDAKCYYGAPSEQYLPTYVRRILKEFFLDQGLLHVKVLMLSMDNKHFDFAISLESLGNPPESEHEGIAEAISWFLPPHYSILLISEKNLPAFYDL